MPAVAWSTAAPIVKVAEERRLITAWASVTKDADGNPVVDSHGDIIETSNLDEIVIKSFARGGLSKGGEMHVDIGGADIVQWLVVDSEEREALGFGKGQEGLIVKMRITDDELWGRIKSGELCELSIGGEGVRSEAA